MGAHLLEVHDLTVRYPGGTRAISGVEFHIGPGEVVGLVGESGGGKTTLALAISRLLPSGTSVSGSILFEGTNMLTAADRDLERIRGRRLSIIWQEPKAALNPVLRCGRQVAEVVRAHNAFCWRQCQAVASTMLSNVNLPARAFEAYPHELSGGQRQRVVIAQALVCHPALVIADEPTASLDTATQAGILDLLREWQAQTQTAFLFITHQPRLLAGFASRTLALREGRMDGA
ncbi:MAG: ABC transporter ATP-binding protein [Bryobacteraceae bacterium]